MILFQFGLWVVIVSAFFWALMIPFVIYLSHGVSITMLPVVSAFGMLLWTYRRIAVAGTVFALRRWA
jgi:hypothetical protein